MAPFFFENALWTDMAVQALKDNRIPNKQVIANRVLPNFIYYYSFVILFFNISFKWLILKYLTQWPAIYFNHFVIIFRYSKFNNKASLITRNNQWIIIPIGFWYVSNETLGSIPQRNGGIHFQVFNIEFVFHMNSISDTDQIANYIIRHWNGH